MNLLKLTKIAIILDVTPALAESMTTPQKNAVRSAKQLLQLQGFSHAGLIKQLSSEYGNGYKISDATIAVESLNVDWNEMAVKSAKQLLQLQGFSCKGLVNQLSSEYGNQYTVEQSTYAATQEGLCE